MFALDIAGPVVSNRQVRLHSEYVAVLPVSTAGSCRSDRRRKIRRGVVVVHVLDYRTSARQHCAVCATGCCNFVYDVSVNTFALLLCRIDTKTRYVDNIYFVQNYKYCTHSTQEPKNKYFKK